MTRADDRILEFLLNQGNEPLNATPAMIEANIDYKISHVRNRIRKLHTADLVKYYDEERGIYQISNKGKEYLIGNLETGDLEHTDP